MTTGYDVATWSVPGNPTATPSNDIGLVINSIIADVKSHQTNQASSPAPSSTSRRENPRSLLIVGAPQH